jgi:hypothetical protein
MAWTVVQSARLTASVSTQNSPLAFSIANLTAGNLILVGIATSAQVIPTLTVSDNAAGGTNTYSELLTATDGNTLCRASLFTAPIVHGAGTKPTVTVAGNQASPFGTVFTIMEVSGVQNVLDKSAVNTNPATSATPTTTATAATTAANELCVAVLANGATDTVLAAGSGWTDKGTVQNDPGCDGSVEVKDSAGSGSTISGTWTSTNQTWCGLIGVFKLAAGVTTNVPILKRRSTGSRVLNPAGGTF